MCTLIPRSRAASVRLTCKAAALPAAGLSTKSAEELKTPSLTQVYFTPRPQLLCGWLAWGFRRVGLKALFGNPQSLIVQVGLLGHVPHLRDYHRPEYQ